MSEQQADPDQAAGDTAQPTETARDDSGHSEAGQPTGNGDASSVANNAENRSSDSESTETSAPKKTRARKQSTAKKSRTVELTLTVTGTAEGEWQADLLHGGKRVVQGLSIPAASVSKAAAELHEEISEAIESVLHAAREQHETKLAELEAEVEKVRKALADLEG